jgi:hypothetical protein
MQHIGSAPNDCGEVTLTGNARPWMCAGVVVKLELLSVQRCACTTASALEPLLVGRNCPRYLPASLKFVS